MFIIIIIIIIIHASHQAGFDKSFCFFLVEIREGGSRAQVSTRALLAVLVVDSLGRKARCSVNYASHC